MLGSVTQLSGLIQLSTSPSNVSLQHGTALGGLTGLQNLDVFIGAGVGTAAGQQHSYLTSLSALTSLPVPLVSVDGLAAIGSCSKLLQLELRGPTGLGVVQPQLDGAACAGLRQLVRLTSLFMEGCRGTASAAFASAPAGMRRLEELIVPDMACATLAALAGLSQLGFIDTSWVPGDAAAAPAVAVCSSVRSATSLGKHCQM